MNDTVAESAINAVAAGDNDPGFTGALEHCNPCMDLLDAGEPYLVRSKLKPPLPAMNRLMVASLKSISLQIR